MLFRLFISENIPLHIYIWVFPIQEPFSLYFLTLIKPSRVQITMKPFGLRPTPLPHTHQPQKRVGYVQTYCLALLGNLESLPIRSSHNQDTLCHNVARASASTMSFQEQEASKYFRFSNLLVNVEVPSIGKYLPNPLPGLSTERQGLSMCHICYLGVMLAGLSSHFFWIPDEK